jgi:hypothetical protein
MVRVAVREFADAFASTVTVTDPLPLIADAAVVAQAWLDDAVHEQPAGAVTFSAAVPPPASTDNDEGDTE